MPLQLWICLWYALRLAEEHNKYTHTHRQWSLTSPLYYLLHHHYYRRISTLQCPPRLLGNAKLHLVKQAKSSSVEPLVQKNILSTITCIVTHMYTHTHTHPNQVQEPYKHNQASALRSRAESIACPDVSHSRMYLRLCTHIMYLHHVPSGTLHHRAYDNIVTILQ